MISTEQAYGFILKDVKSFNLLPDSFKCDKEFIKKCLRVPSFITNLKYIRDDLKHDESFVRELIGIKGLALFYMGEEFQADKEFFLLAFTQDQDLFLFDLVGDDLKIYKNDIDKLRDDVKAEKLKLQLDEVLILVDRRVKLKKI